MSNPTLHVTRGLPAAGKTTWAKAWVLDDPLTRARVNRDDLRAMMFIKPTYEWQQEQQVTAVQRAAVRDLLTGGYDVVVDDMHLRPKYVQEWHRFVSTHGAVVELHEFPVDVDEAIRRDADRHRTVGAEFIRHQAGKYLPKGRFLPVTFNEATADQPSVDPYDPDPGLPWAIIVDVDGTVARKAPGRDIYDLTKVSQDLPNWRVIEAVQSAKRDGLEVIYCTGRQDTHGGQVRVDTALWLADHVEVPGMLLMRADGDQRRDAIVKRELFDQHIRHRYNVRRVYDDRQQVVDMWRGLGLTCMQVAPGDF